MIVSALVFLLSVVIFVAGAFAQSSPGISLLLTLPAGVLLTFIHHLMMPADKVHHALNGELTLGQFRQQTAMFSDEVILYSAHPISFISSWFPARFGEHRAIVLERSE